MNTREIKTLVDKYFEGETTLQEEEQLKYFFNSDEVPEELQELVPVFTFFKEEKRIVPSGKLNGQILQIPVTARILPFMQRRSFWLTVAGIAASILLIVTIVIESGKNRPSYQDHFTQSGFTREEAQIAYKQTQQALAYVSEKFNRGTEPLSQVAKIEYSSKFVEDIKKFDKGLSNLSGNMDKMDKGVGTLSKLSKINIIIKL